VIRELRSSFPQLSVHRMCVLLKVSRALVYQPVRDPSRPDLLSAIESIVTKFLGYGYRRVHHELANRGIQTSIYEVRTQMREHGLSARRPPSKGITRRNPRDRAHLNLMREFKPAAPDQVWAADLTQIRTNSGTVYMAALIDVFSRKVVGWHLSRNPDTKLALACLEKAIQSRRPAAGWMHHSDQGSTYTAVEYVSRVRAAGGRMSMSRPGRPTDNPFIESFYSTLKKEEVRPNHYSSFLEAESGLARYMSLYNEERMHSSLGNVSPSQFEAITGEEGR